MHVECTRRHVYFQRHKCSRRVMSWHVCVLDGLSDSRGEWYGVHIMPHIQIWAPRACQEVTLIHTTRESDRLRHQYAVIIAFCTPQNTCFMWGLLTKWVVLGGSK